LSGFSKNHVNGKISINETTHCIYHFLGSWLTDSEQKYYMVKRFICKHMGKPLGLAICFSILVVFLVCNYGLNGGIQRLMYKISFCVAKK
jgi:hypothetical protein